MTISGSEDQLLSLVIGKERPGLASLNEELIEKQTGFTIRMKKLEDNILFKLASSVLTVPAGRRYIPVAHSTYWSEYRWYGMILLLSVVRCIIL
jgi:hypothetical protein